MIGWAFLVGAALFLLLLGLAVWQQVQQALTQALT
jgi:hypothetical protein